MSVFDIFTKNATPAQQPQEPQQPAPQEPAQQQQQAAPQEPGGIPNQQPSSHQPTTGQEPNGSIPNNPDTTVNSPLDQYKDLWQNDPNSKSSDPNPSQPLDAAKLREVISKANFSNTLNQETLAQIAQGGEGATKAFADSMNEVARQVMMQATLASDKLTDQRIKAALEAHQAKLPEMLRTQSLRNNLSDTNPLFKNPAVKPVMEAVQTQLATKNPDATPAELAEMTQNFIRVMGESFAPAPPKTNDQFSDTDWEKFLAG